MKEPTPRQLPSGRWFCRVRINGQDIGITEETEAAAKAKALALKAGLKDIARHPNHETVRSVVDRYIEGRDGILSPSTIRSYLAYARTRFQSLMDLRLCDLNSAICQKSIALEARTASPKTVRNAWGLISAAVAEADPDLTLRVRLPAKPTAAGRALDPEELRRIFAEIHGTRYELPLLLDAFLGLRRSELFALRKSDFNFTESSVTISRTYVLNKNGKWEERTATKTTAGRRTIPVDETLMEMVKACPAKGRLFQDIHPNTPYEYLKRLTKRLGLPPVRLHDLRHTFASVSHLLGVPEKYTMASGGWSSKPVLYTIYTHTLEEGRKEYGERVATFYRDLLPKNGNKGDESQESNADL